MSTQTMPLTEYRRKSGTNRLGLWLFLISDAFVFLGLLVARFNLLGLDVRPELNQFLGLAITLVLLVSSYCMFRAETAMSFGDYKSFSLFMMATIGLGVLFLLGVVGLEWQIAPGGPADGAMWSIFYAMTGFHAFHVLTGVALLAIVFRNARKGLYNAQRHYPVEAAAVYWHFVDVVWMFFYPALYLIGTAAV
jgi:cytochrome c oxidase subunit 3